MTGEELESLVEEVKQLRIEVSDLQSRVGRRRGRKPPEEMKQCLQLREMAEQALRDNAEHPVVDGVDVFTGAALYGILRKFTNAEEEGLLVFTDNVALRRPQLAKMTRMMRAAGVRTGEGDVLYDSATRNRAVKKQRFYVMRNAAKYDAIEDKRMGAIADEQCERAFNMQTLLTLLHGYNPYSEMKLDKVIEAYNERGNGLTMPEMLQWVKEREQQGLTPRNLVVRLNEHWYKYNREQGDKPAPLTYDNKDTYLSEIATVDTTPSFF